MTELRVAVGPTHREASLLCGTDNSGYLITTYENLEREIDLTQTRSLHLADGTAMIPVLEEAVSSLVTGGLDDLSLQLGDSAADALQVLGRYSRVAISSVHEQHGAVVIGLAVSDADHVTERGVVLDALDLLVRAQTTTRTWAVDDAPVPATTPSSAPDDKARGITRLIRNRQFRWLALAVLGALLASTAAVVTALALSRSELDVTAVLAALVVFVIALQSAIVALLLLLFRRHLNDMSQLLDRTQRLTRQGQSIRKGVGEIPFIREYMLELSSQQAKAARHNPTAED